MHISSCSISVFSLCRDMGKWPSEIQKITIKWNWCSDGFSSLVSDHFDCFYNDLHHERCTVTPCSKSEFSLCRDGKKLVAQKSHKEWSYRHCFCCVTSGIFPKNYIHRATGRLLVFVTLWRRIQTARSSFTFWGNHICKRIDLY